MDHHLCGPRSEPDGTPTTRSGSHNSVVTGATYTTNSQKPSGSPSQDPYNDLNTNSGPNRGNKMDNKGNNGSKNAGDNNTSGGQVFNIPIGGHTITEQRIRPGEFVMRVLFSEFTATAEKKIELIMSEPSERSLSKSLQRGEDIGFDQLLTALGSVAEHCLPSILRTLFSWYDRQAVTWLGTPISSGSVSSATGSSISSGFESLEKEPVISLDPQVAERRDMAVEFILCLVLIEVLKQLPFHPGHHDLVGKIEDLCFAHFKYREGTCINAANGLVIADLYAEVLGVLAQARFSSVRVRFLNELSELRGKEANSSVTQSIISLLMGMKFFRIKMAPIEDFEASFQFLTECAKYFLEVKQRDIKHALAGLFVEILVPVAATVKHEVNVPCLKSFVEMLYAPTLDMCTRSKHRLAIFPLVTCLLCVSQKPFFLHNWHYFLANCLSQLKSREPKMSRVALESLYRLLWAYMIRIKCESNSATQSRLLSVVNSLFPKGSKGVVPRDTPLNIFVKIIQFIAQERLDFAMREIVFELLSVGRPIKIILTPERMNIGLRAFLVAADSLQQKDGDPPMPRAANVMPSGNTLLRVKKTFLNKVLTEDAARSIGMASYYPLIRKVFTDILRALDLQCGRPLLLTTVKEQEESLLTGDRKAKIDLFRTCVAAIPRLIPDGMSRTELLSLLARLTLHIDEELRGLAFQSLQSLLLDFPDWRHDVLTEFLAFASKEVPDTAPQQLDNSLRMLVQLLTSWRNAVSSPGGQIISSTTNSSATFSKTKKSSENSQPSASIANSSTCFQAEGLALLMLCSVRSSTRRIGCHILKEIKALSEIIGLTETPVIDVLDRICPLACEKVSNILPIGEKQAILAAISCSALDLQWVTDRSCTAWYTQEDEGVNQAPTQSSSSLSILQSAVSHNTLSTDVSITNDAWAMCLKEFLDYQNVPTQCPRAVLEAWSIIMPKINAVYSYLEPSPVQDNRASLLRSATTPRRPPIDRNLYFKLWRNYLLFAFRTVPPNIGSSIRCVSPDMASTNICRSPVFSPEGSDGVREGRSPLPLTSAMLFSVTPSSLYKLVVPLIRLETIDIRDFAVHSLGQINYMAVKDLFEELGPYLKEASDRKQENVRRRKRKDNLRLQLLRIFELIAKENTFGKINLINSCTTSNHGHHLGDNASVLPLPLQEFFDTCKGWLEAETDREGGFEMRLNFCKGFHYFLKSFELDLKESLLRRETKKQLFYLCISWAGSYSSTLGKDIPISIHSSSTANNIISYPGISNSQQAELEFSALQAAAGLLTCGPIFQQILLSEESQLYSWLDYLLSSQDGRVSQLGEEVMIMLLEFNPDVGSVLDWVVATCFTGSSQIADACFRAMATLFSAREYPCDRYVAIINSALLYSGCSKFQLQQTAFRLLQVLDRRFFGGLPPLQLHHLGSEISKDDAPNTLDALLSRSSYAKNQTFLSKQLSFLHPELTMPIFSEISWRMKSARSDVRQSLLRYLQPWLHNMELVEPAIPSPSTITPLACFELDICSENLRESVSSSSSCSLCGKRNVEEGERMIRRGWGSTEATEMVLNNLLYLTAKFGEEHEREIEECWQTLCCSSPNNQRVVLYYLLIVTGLAPSEILPHAKRVLIYLFRARPVRLLEDLIAELQTVESLSWLVEKTETPPFYRLSHLRKTSSYSDTNVAPQHINGGATLNYSNNASNSQFQRVPVNELEKGTIHTKRRSAEESSVFQQQQQQPPPHLRSSSSGATGLFRSEKTRTISGPAALPDTQFLTSEKEKIRTALYETEALAALEDDQIEYRYPSSETIAPGGISADQTPSGFPTILNEEGMETNVEHHLKLLPLPMPEYGGYYAPLKEFLSSQQVPPFHRSNLAMMFISELINEGTTIIVSTEDSKKERKIDWCSQYLPLLIHMAFLGLDHLRPLVNLHSYNILINLLVVSGAHRNHLAISKLSLNQQTKDIKLGLTFPYLSLKSYDFLDPKAEFVTSTISSKPPTAETLGVSSSPVCQSPSQSPKSSPRTPSKRPHTPVNLLVIPEPSEYGAKRPLTIQEKTLALIKYLTGKRGETLWNCEDITARVWNIRSANQLLAFVQNSFDVLFHCYPNSMIDRKWAQASLQIGLACSSRHLAGRSLQIFRALKVPLVSRILCDILSRLVETVAETGDDMQGYVSELILTLEACVEAIPTDRDLYSESIPGVEGPKFEKMSKDDMFSTTHIRPRSGTETFGIECKRTELGRSRSVQSLNGLNDGLLDDAMDRNLNTENDVIPQVFWLALSLLESDFEYEYLLAVRLLEKIMDRLPLERLDCRDKVDRVQSQLQWNSFSGIIPLILKGCSNVNTYEQSLTLLLRFIPFLEVNFVDPTGESGFPLSVIALLPLLLLHYDDPTPLCVRAAQLIAEVGACKGDNGAQALQHLSTVMTLYSRRSFSKESMQWTKCVIKYLYDSYSHLAPLLLGFLLDVLEKGPPNVQPSVLSALHCSFNYVDLTSMNTVSTELLRAIEKHLDGPHWRDSLKILKLVVTRSSSLVAPGPQNYSGSSGPSSMISAWDSVSTTSSVAFTTDSEFSYKKELPGRTMEFTFDVSQTPIIGRKHIVTNQTKEEAPMTRLSLGLNTQGNFAQRSGSVGEMGLNGYVVIQSNWKRPWQCQSRVRECLVSVLNACGQRVGLPKSPSVIFSQSSELLERQSSVASSTEEVSVAINDTSGASRLDDGSASDAHFRVFRDFDFLEYELESVDGESSDNFNWGVRRRPLSELGTEPETEGETENEALGSRRSRSRSQTSSDLTTVVNNSQGNFSGGRPGDIQLQDAQLPEEESSDEEDLGLSPLDEHGPPIQGRNSDPPTPQPNLLTMIELGSSQVSSPARSRRLSDTSLDSRSEEETTPCNVSPQGGELLIEAEEELEEEEEEDEAEGDDTDANVTSEILNEGEGDADNSENANSVIAGPSNEAREIQNRIIEDFRDWKSILQLFLVGIRPLQSLESIQTMSQMVQTSFCEVIYVCQDITALLTSLGFEISIQISQIISVLLDFSNEHNLHMAAWHLWCAKDVIRGEEVKIFLLEASEHLETLNDRKETLQECIEGGLKPLVKLKALEGELPTYEESQSPSFGEATSADPFEIIADVSKLLYRTLFQLRLLLECHQRAVQSLANNPKSKIRDLSRQVLEVRAALLQCISTLVIQGDKGSKLGLREAEGCLLDLLLANQWENSIELFKANTDIWPKDLIGNSSNDVTGILNIYCNYLSEEHSGVFVSIPNDFRNLCSQVNSVCLHLLENQQTLERKTLV